jgi:hypothetical protein
MTLPKRGKLEKDEAPFVPLATCQNGLAWALREVGRIEKTLFTLEWFQSLELLRQVQETRVMSVTQMSGWRRGILT